MGCKRIGVPAERVDEFIPPASLKKDGGESCTCGLDFPMSRAALAQIGRLYALDIFSLHCSSLHIRSRSFYPWGSLGLCKPCRAAPLLPHPRLHING